MKIHINIKYIYQKEKDIGNKYICYGKLILNNNIRLFFSNIDTINMLFIIFCML